MAKSLRFVFLIGTLLASHTVYAGKVLIQRDAPQGCTELEMISVESGSKTQGLFFSDAWIENNAMKKLRKAAKKAGGNRVVIKDRREFLMDSQFRGIKRIELDAWVWHCDDKDD